MATTVMTDVVSLLVALGLAGLCALVVHVARELTPRRPALPAEDCPPPGLSRLVPVGRQVDQECRSGLDALELWLATRRVRP